MNQALKDKRMTLRELSEKTGINPSRLSDLRQGRAEPGQHECDMICMVLGSNIKFAESEEAKKAHQEMMDTLSAMQKVYDKVKALGLGKGKGGKGEMDCPKCGSKLVFSVSSFNGHAWGKCSTDGCLMWME